MVLSESELKILTYLGAVYATNQRAETPLVELERELQLAPEETRAAVVQLVTEGVVEADLFPLNVWTQISEAGLAALQRARDR